MAQDAKTFVAKCDKCQRFANIPRQPPAELTTLTAPWPFAQWGLDIVGPLPMAAGQVKFLLVGIDYFTKWVEALPLAKITEQNATQFLRKMIVCRFGIPKVIVTDNGKQLDNKRFKEFCADLGIELHFASVAHPQSNWQVEVTNRSLLKIIKTKLEQAKGLWAEELPNVLWAYQTTARTPTGATPYLLTYGHEAVLPVEIGLPSARTAMYDPLRNEEELRLDLDLIEEERELATMRTATYQSRMRKSYNARVKERSFQVGDLVLRKVMLAAKNPSEGKLGPNWEGPYVVTALAGRGAYRLQDMEGRDLGHPWNAQHLRRYYP
ncbi:hypothetical protein U1Q18_052479 [Sarracenia purpurea var. burkii]